MAAWAAQQRADIDQAIIIAPFFSHRLIPNSLNRWITRLILKLPNLRLGRPLGSGLGGGPHPIHSPPASHTLGQVARLGLHTQAQARRSPPRAGRVTMVLNPHDPVVNNRIARDIGAQWRRHGHDQLEIYDLNKALRLPHDIVNPHIKKQNVVLTHLITRRGANEVVEI